jgi:hypothetical protein
VGTIINDDACSFSIMPTSQNFANSAGMSSVNVTSATGCEWIATSNDAWIVITSGSSGDGNGTVNYSVAANSGPARMGTITIAGQTFTVTQDGVSTGIFQITQSVIAGGGGRSTSGTYSLDGTIGQCLAGTESTGGRFSLLSGFWAASNMTLASRRAPFALGGEVRFAALAYRPPWATMR